MIAPLDIAPIPPESGEDPDIVAEVVALWRACGLTRPWNDPVADLRLAVAGPASTVLAGRQAGRLVATVMVGHDGHRGAVYYVAVDPAAQGRGHGRAIMAAAEAWLRERGVPKLNIMVRRENAKVRAFYDALGAGEDDVIVLSKRF